MYYVLLDWDSNFFGMKVARITEPNLTAEELTYHLSSIKQNRVKLVYWPSDRKCEDYEVKRFCGYLADNKTTFFMDFRCLSFDDFVSTNIVEPYTHSMPIADIEDLAIQCGEYSRFAVDPNIQRDKFVALYKNWINQSLSKDIASEVLVIREGDRVIGMVTLGDKNGIGDIGLIAVDKSCRGKKHGDTLVRAAQQWFVKKGYKFGQVVTQGGNIPACNLYKKCGYSIKKQEYYYHFWL